MHECIGKITQKEKKKNFRFIYPIHQPIFIHKIPYVYIVIILILHKINTKVSSSTGYITLFKRLMKFLSSYRFVVT